MGGRGIEQRTDRRRPPAILVLLHLPVDARQYDVAAAMLAELGVKSIELMTNNPEKISGVSGFGLEVVSQEPIEVEVDIMVPDGFAPAGGRRSIRLPPHSKSIARRAVGLEGAILDNDLMEIGALSASDRRQFTVRVAGPAALVIAKAHKIRDRLADGRVDRIADKDAADVYRLMLAVPVGDLVERLRPLLGHEAAGPACRDGVNAMRRLFGTRAGRGVEMAIEALRTTVPSERVVDVCTGFVSQVRTALEE